MTYISAAILLSNSSLSHHTHTNLKKCRAYFMFQLPTYIILHNSNKLIPLPFAHAYWHKAKFIFTLWTWRRRYQFLSNFTEPRTCSLLDFILFLFFGVFFTIGELVIVKKGEKRISTTKKRKKERKICLHNFRDLWVTSFYHLSELIVSKLKTLWRFDRNEIIIL